MLGKVHDWMSDHVTEEMIEFSNMIRDNFHDF